MTTFCGLWTRWLNYRHLQRWTRFTNIHINPWEETGCFSLWYIWALFVHKIFTRLHKQLIKLLCLTFKKFCLKYLTFEIHSPFVEVSSFNLRLLIVIDTLSGGGEKKNSFYLAELAHAHKSLFNRGIQKMLEQRKTVCIFPVSRISCGPFSS